MFEYLEIVMDRIRKHHLKINWKKCQWFKLKVKLLGQEISFNKIEMDKEPLIAIKIGNAQEKEKIENLLKDFENEKKSQAVILEEKSRESEERKINFVNEKNAEFLKKEEKRSIELKSLKDRLEKTQFL